jgi:hypothetical protein
MLAFKACFEINFFFFDIADDSRFRVVSNFAAITKGFLTNKLLILNITTTTTKNLYTTIIENEFQ